MKGSALATVSAICLCSGSFQDITQNVGKNYSKKKEQVLSWDRFCSSNGKCRIAFPSTPEHVNQIVPFNEQGYDLRYDVYVSPYEQSAVYMMLIAEYPPFVNEAYSEMSLESFLNGLLTQNPDNELIFADLVNIQGHKGLDFFISAKGTYFKGRAIMSDNNLYLLAMECDEKSYKDDCYTHFIESFEFLN